MNNETLNQQQSINISEPLQQHLKEENFKDKFNKIKFKFQTHYNTIKRNQKRGISEPETKNWNLFRSSNSTPLDRTIRLPRSGRSTHGSLNPPWCLGERIWIVEVGGGFGISMGGFKSVWFVRVTWK